MNSATKRTAVLIVRSTGERHVVKLDKTFSLIDAAVTLSKKYKSTIDLEVTTIHVDRIEGLSAPE